MADPRDPPWLREDDAVQLLFEVNKKYPSLSRSDVGTSTRLTVMGIFY